MNTRQNGWIQIAKSAAWSIVLGLLIPPRSLGVSDPPPNCPLEIVWESTNCPSLVTTGSISPTYFACIEVGKAPTVPTNVVWPEFSNGSLSGYYSTDCGNSTSSTNVSIQYTVDKTVRWSPWLPAVFTNAGNWSSTAWVKVTSSDSNACHAYSEILGEVTWHVVNTNWTEVGVAFHGTNRWKLKSVGFLGDPAGGGAAVQYDGFVVKFEVLVDAYCSKGCSIYTNSATRIKTIEHDETIEVQQVGSGGVSVPLPTSLAQATGEAIAAIIGDNIQLYGVNSDTLTQMASQINGDKSASTNWPATDGSWKDGSSPCASGPQ